MESILITGASGFIGSFIVEEALKRKFGVWAGVRSSSSREYLRDRKIHFLELDFAHPNELRAQLSGHKGTYNKFDYIVHCAGVTKCVDKNEFDLVNYLQTKYFIDTLRELNMIPKQFIFISTLSVFGPVRERTYDPIMESDPPSPNTAYGLSKLKTELYLQSIPGFPYVIYRPTGVYGPREKDYYLMAKPGMTGLWQVSGRNNVSYDTRVYFDTWYAKNWSLWNDIVILLKTVKVVWKKTGAY